MLRIVCPAAVLMLASCSQLEVSPFSPQPGVTGYVIKCGRHTEQCYQQAEKSCAKGFDVVNSSTQTTTGGLVPVGNSVVASTATNTTLVVSCKT